LPSRGRYIGYTPSLHLVPQSVQHLQAGRPHVDSSVSGEPLDRLEALPEFPIGLVECRAGLNPCFPGQVDHGKEQISDLVNQCITGTSSRRVRVRIRHPVARPLAEKLVLDLDELFPNLLDRTRGVGPVEPHRRGALLQPKGHQQVRQGRDKTREHVSFALATLDVLPGLALAEIEKVGMTAPHLGFQLVGHLPGGELPSLLTDDELERQVEQQIAQLSPDLGDIAFPQCVVQLERLFHQVRPQRVSGLRPVPRASLPQVPHRRHGTSERRIVLHFIPRAEYHTARLAMTFPSEISRAWVDVDLAALVANARTVAAISGSRLLPMVKANGYGLGAVAVARALQSVDPWGFGVASVDEAAALRADGITRPLLVVTPLLPQWIEQFLELDLRPSIGDPAALQAWTTRTERPFHVEIDTGMSRAGVRWDDRASLDTLRSALGQAPGWEGVFTHFLAAESDADTTVRQWDRFQEIVDSLPRRPALVHAANSAAALRGRGFAADLVRPGIFLYGGAAGRPEPRPVAALRGRVVAIRSVAAGDTVGYSASWRADRRSVIATISVGYADGFPRAAPNDGSRGARVVEVNGKLAPLVGRVTMDMCMAAVEHDATIGDIATVFGGLVTLDRQASAAGSISYELLTRLGPRVPRRYERPS
jgi:alanine racemase